MEFIKGNFTQEFEVMLGNEKRETINTLIHAVQEDNPEAMEVQIPLQVNKNHYVYTYHFPQEIPGLFSKLAETEFKGVNEKLLYYTYERFGENPSTGKPLQRTYFGIELLNPTKTQNLLKYSDYLLQYLVNHYLYPVHGIAAFEYEVIKGIGHDSEFSICHKDTFKVFAVGKQYENHINFIINIDEILTLLQ